MSIMEIKLDFKKIAKIKPNPVFKGLPKSLKDPTKYKETELLLFKILESDHKHDKPSDWMKCKICQDKFKEKKKTMKKLGFKNSSQYLEWRKVMDILVNNKTFIINEKNKESN